MPRWVLFCTDRNAVSFDAVFPGEPFSDRYRGNRMVATDFFAQNARKSPYIRALFLFYRGYRVAARCER